MQLPDTEAAHWGKTKQEVGVWVCSNNIYMKDPQTDVPFLSPHSPLSIPSVVVTISILANPQQSGGMHLLVARLVLSLPDVQADCAEQKPYRRRRTKSDCLHNKICSKRILCFISGSTHEVKHGTGVYFSYCRLDWLLW